MQDFGDFRFSFGVGFWVWGLVVKNFRTLGLQLSIYDLNFKVPPVRFRFSFFARGFRRRGLGEGFVKMMGPVSVGGP